MPDKPEPDMLRRAYKRLDPEKQPIGIYAVDVNGVFGFVNAQACELLHKSVTDLTGTRIHDLYADPRDRDTFMEQLATDGRIVIPVGKRNTQRLIKVVKGEKIIEKHDICGCMFVPLIGDKGWKP